MQTKNILVTGAAGFVAFHLIEELLTSGYAVTGIDNFDAFYGRGLKIRNIEDLKRHAMVSNSKFTFIEQDIRSVRENQELRRDFDAVVHLAAKAGVRPSLLSPREYSDVNVTGTLEILEFCRLHGIQNLIFGSSSSVYGNDTVSPFREDASASLPVSPYAATKRAGELLCQTYGHLYGLRVAILRFFTVYGPRQRPDLAIRSFTECVSQGREITLYGDGNSSRDYTYVTDIVKGIIAAIGWTDTKARPGQCEVFNLGGSHEISLIDLVRLIETKLGESGSFHKAKIRWVQKQPGDVEKTCADLSKSYQFLGYSPCVPIEDGIARFVNWFVSTNYPKEVKVASNSLVPPCDNTRNALDFPT